MKVNHAHKILRNLKLFHSHVCLPADADHFDNNKRVVLFAQILLLRKKIQLLSKKHNWKWFSRHRELVCVSANDVSMIFFHFKIILNEETVTHRFQSQSSFQLRNVECKKVFATWAQFHQRSTYSFYERRSQIRQKIQSSQQCHLALLGRA